MPEDSQNIQTGNSFSGEDSSILKDHLTHFLQHRQPPKTFCPSEVARALSSSELSTLGFTHWRDAMPSVRQLAWNLRQSGECEILQKGETIPEDVEPEDVRGPIRIRRGAG